jgi:hypothetical protein
VEFESLLENAENGFDITGKTLARPLMNNTLHNSRFRVRLAEFCNSRHAAKKFYFS